MNNKKKKILYPVYLDDMPVPQETGLSKAIADEISSNPEQNRIIGLLGSWGSGKSSAIEAIKKELKDKCTIFEYDAWKNEQFPFKLGFLKFLLSEVNNEENKELYSKLQNKVSSLEQVCQEQKSRQQGIISFDNLIIALPIAFFPLAFSLLNGSGQINPNIITDILLNSNYKVLIYVILFSILKLINWRLKSEKRSGINFSSVFINIPIIIGLSILSVFINTLPALILSLPLFLWLLFNLKNFILKIINSKTEYNIISIKTPDVKNTITINKSIEPSFIDFQETYNDILSYSYTTKKNNSFLIVIDNIDRVEIEETKKIWSALKGMILKNNKGNIYTNIIIPVDEEQILKLYNDAKNEDTDNKPASFIQKTFDMTYRVSPFIIDNVEKFLYQKLDESFGKDKFLPDEKQKILNIFNSRNYNEKVEENLFIQSSYKGQATPRKIIKLINEVVSLERNLTFKDVSITAKFAYIIHYNNISTKIQNKIYKNFLPNNSITMINIEKNELSDLISLYYGVNRESAIKLARTEDLMYKIYSEEEIDKSIKEIPNMWLIVNDIIENTIFDKPFSVIMNCLKNIMTLNSDNGYANFNNILKNIVSKLTALDNINDYTSIDSDIICCALKNIDNKTDAIDTINLLYNFDELKNEYSREEAEKWYKCFLSIVSIFNISKSEIYNILSSYIPEALYKHIVDIVKPEDMEYIDSYIFECDSEKLENLKEKEFIYSNANFILNFPPLNEKKEDWMNKVYQLNSGLIELLKVNYNGVIDLLYKFVQLTKSNDETTKNYILSNEYYNNILNSNYKNKELLAKAFAIYTYFEPSLSKVQNYTRQQPSANWRIVFNENDEKYIHKYTKSYINLQNDILSVYDLPQLLSNKNSIISYAIDNIKEFNMNVKNFFIKFDKFANKHRDILYNKFIEYSDSTEIMSSLDYNCNNISLLYYLSCKDDAKNNITNNANKFLNTIPEDQWENELRNCSEKFKIALNLNFDNAGFKNVFYKIDKIMMEKGIDYFINSMQNEVGKLQEYDKTYKFINNLLDNNLKNINDPTSIINNFSESTLKWLKKTSHDSETLYTDFIRKVNNEEWLINNKTFIEKHISSDENKTNFADKWKENDNIKKAYNKIFEKIQQQNVS